MHLRQYTADDWVAIFTGLSAVIFFAQLIVFAVQARVFSIQARRLKETINAMNAIAAGQTEDMTKSISAAARSAKAMEESALHNEETLYVLKDNAERQLRAYLRVDVQSPQETSKGGISCRFSGGAGNLQIQVDCAFYVINSGQTPAYAVVDSMNIFDPCPTYLKTVPAIQALAAAGDRGKSVVNPGQGITLLGSRTIGVSNAVLTDLNTGKLMIVVTGTINFVDAFKKARSLNYAFNSERAANGATLTRVFLDGNDAD